MDKKELQKKRMMGYFIEAGKQIIREEGLRELTVRKVADLAGYSYATLYNYFPDLHGLLLYCTIDFQDECYQALAEAGKGHEGLERLIRESIAYVEYFIANPNVFELIYMNDSSGAVPEELAELLYRPKIGRRIRENMAECVAHGLLRESEMEIMVELISMSLVGKLLFHLRRRRVVPPEMIVQNVEREIRYLMGKKEG